MHRRVRFLSVVSAAAIFLAGCDQAPTTPPEVERAYGALSATLNPDTPGHSVAMIRQFVREHPKDPIAARIERDTTTWQAPLNLSLTKAQQLMQAGNFERAEILLQDLALATDQPAGTAAAELLAFDLPHLKALQLLDRGDLAGADTIARTLLTKQLTDAQRAFATKLMEQVNALRQATTMSHQSSLRSAAQALSAHMAAEKERLEEYPAFIDFGSNVLRTARNNGTLSAMSGVDGFTSTKDTYALTVVGRSGQRIRVTEKGIQ